MVFLAQFAVDCAAGTLTWPNSIDFTPDLLCAEVTANPTTELDAKPELI